MRRTALLTILATLIVPGLALAGVGGAEGELPRYEIWSSPQELTIYFDGAARDACLWLVNTGASTPAPNIEVTLLTPETETVVEDPKHGSTSTICGRIRQVDVTCSYDPSSSQTGGPINSCEFVWAITAP